MEDKAPLLKLVIDRDEEYDPHEWLPPLDRRAALRMLGLSAMASFVGCGTGGTPSSSSSSSGGGVATTTSLTATPASVTTGANVTMSAAVSPAAATGSVTFYNGSTSLGSAALASGGASLATSFSTAGTETLKAVYAGDGTYAGSTSSNVSIAVTASSSTCSSQTLEGEEGPYFVDDSASGYNRTNILSNVDGTNTQTGVPFALTLYVYDAKNGCSAMQNVQVDIWHCNAKGVYSGEASESTAGQSWCRGYQLTDSNGMVQFTTIVPGWYSGRTTHIHLRLRSSYNAASTGGNNTMQLFFDQNLIDTLDTSVSPYSSEGKNSTTNASDRVYTQQENGTTLMTLSGSTSAGYAATAKIYLPIS